MSDLTQARAALAQSDHPCGVLHSAPDLEGEIKEACALAPGHDGAHYGYAPFVDWKVHLRTALAEVDRLTARVADLEHLEASQHKARARDVAGIVGWLRKEAVKKANTSEAAGNTGAGLTASIQYAELWFTADAIERGDWHDGTLPADPRDAERLNLLDYAGGLENTIENMLWNLGGVSSVCMGALDADFTFDESAARAALYDAVKLRREYLSVVGKLRRYREHLNDIRCDILDRGHPLGDDADPELTPRRLVRELLDRVPDPKVVASPGGGWFGVSDPDGPATTRGEAAPGMVSRLAAPVVGGVCASYYVDDQVNRYCELGECLHDVHEGDGRMWTDDGVNARIDERVR